MCVGVFFLKCINKRPPQGSKFVPQSASGVIEFDDEDMEIVSALATETASVLQKKQFEKMLRVKSFFPFCCCCCCCVCVCVNSFFLMGYFFFFWF